MQMLRAHVRAYVRDRLKFDGQHWNSALELGMETAATTGNTLRWNGARNTRPVTRCASGVKGRTSALVECTSNVCTCLALVCHSSARIFHSMRPLPPIFYRASYGRTHQETLGEHKPFIAASGLIRCLNFAKDFVVAGTAAQNLLVWLRDYGSQTRNRRICSRPSLKPH